MSILCNLGIHIERFFRNDVAAGSACPCGKKTTPPITWPMPPPARSPVLLAEAAQSRQQIQDSIFSWNHALTFADSHDYGGRGFVVQMISEHLARLNALL